MSITSETRREAYYEILPDASTRRQQVYSVLRVHGAMTAEEVTERLVRDGVIPFFDYNYVRPRLTELKQDGLVEVIGKRESRRTKKNTAIWEVRDENTMLS